jgi:hypothetical protein
MGYLVPKHWGETPGLSENTRRVASVLGPATGGLLALTASELMQNMAHSRLNKINWGNT